MAFAFLRNASGDPVRTTGELGRPNPFMLVLTTWVTIWVAPHSELWPCEHEFLLADVLIGGPESGINLLESFNGTATFF